MFTKSASFYDVIYAALGKDYEAEAKRLRELIQQYKQSSGTAVLDVACGTGRHIEFLRQFYTVEGLDRDPNMLAIARNRNPGVAFHQGSVLNFDLRKKFDVITCLFSAIGVVKTVPNLRKAIKNMARHLNLGGVLIVEPWLTPEAFEKGRIGAVFVDQPKLKIARMNTTILKDRVSILNFHYLIGTPDGMRHLTERHELGLFAHDDYLSAFHASGIQVVHDARGLIGRGLYIGMKPLK